MPESFGKSSHRGATSGADDWKDFGAVYQPSSYLSEEEWRELNKTDEMQYNGEYKYLIIVNLYYISSYL